MTALFVWTALSRFFLALAAHIEANCGVGQWSSNARQRNTQTLKNQAGISLKQAACQFSSTSGA